MIFNPMYNEADTRGYKPADVADDLIGAEFVHTNGTVYQIVKFVFDAEDDLWRIDYRPSNYADRHLSFSRTPENFFGKNASGEARFRRIKPEGARPKFNARGVEHDGRGPG